MRTPGTLPQVVVTMGDVMADLEAGRSLPVRPADRLVTLPSRRRPTLGGPAFLRAWLAARVLGRIHPRLAQRPLLRLWLTPWVHPSTRRPVTGLTDDVRPWSLDHDGRTLRGYTAGTGPTVVLLHGWAGRAADWRHLAHDLLDAGWRIVAPDLPAHGATVGITTDVFELSSAAAAVLRSELPAAVVTHSLGFPVTLLALRDLHDPPTTLVALAPGRRMRDAVDRFIERARLPVVLADELREAVRQRFGRDIWEVLDVDRAVADLPQRGLVVHDDADVDVPITDGRHIAAHWTGASFVATTGLGHRRILRDRQVRHLVVDALGATGGDRPLVSWSGDPVRAH